MSDNFDQQVISHVNVIHCPKVIDDIRIKRFLDLMPTWVRLTEKLHVMDFKTVVQLSPDFYRPMGIFHQKLIKKGSLVASLNVSDEISRQIRNDGLEKIFHPISNIKEVLTELGLLDQTMAKEEISAITVEFLSPLVGGILNAISTMVNIKVSVNSGKPIQDKSVLKTDIVATVEIGTQLVDGCIGLYSSEEIMKDICVKALQSSKVDVLREGQDLSREILNVASGKAKTEWIEKYKYSMKRGTAQSLSKDAIKKHREAFFPEAVILAFTTPFGLFYMGILVVRKDGKGALNFRG
jgi:hypothetical protein